MTEPWSSLKETKVFLGGVGAFDDGHFWMRSNSSYQRHFVVVVVVVLVLVLA